jgi:Helitron helicase-like domain at N-terminus
MEIRNSQQQLRAECYQGIVDALGANDSTHIGCQIIVPATTTGSTRCMQQRFQDSMALVRKFGKLDVFFTMTCNPKWPEITELLEPH